MVSPLTSTFWPASKAVTVIERRHSGGLSPDGMHGALVLQTCTSLTSATTFTNLPSTASTGSSVFDDLGRKTYTNAMNGTSGYLRARIQALGE
jgi:hypothetical protein